MPDRATLMVTMTDDSGEGSLRWAITRANAAGDATIMFSIGHGSRTITPYSALPEIATRLTIDATSQPGYTGTPLIEIDGVHAGENIDGLVIVSEECTVRGLCLVRFGGVGLIVAGAGGNQISGNRIGIDAIGGAGKGNASGIDIRSPNNRIGGVAPGDGNVISGNGKDGLTLTEHGRNVVQGNLIGTDPRGNAPLPNGWHGVLVLNSADNLIGGDTPTARNTVSGNGRWGIRVAGGGATRNRIRGNFVGTDISGRHAVPNGRSGVLIFNASANIIGGNQAGEGNLISGNSRQGVTIDGSSLRLDFGDAPLTRVAVGGGGCRNNIVAGNRIGTDVTGTTALGNGLQGIMIFMAQDNIIGGDAASANLISGNAKNGISLSGANPSGADWRTYMRNFAAGEAVPPGPPEPLPASLAVTGNVIAGNVIGLDASANDPIGNGESGIAVNHAGANVIGGNVGAANVVSGNGRHGIHINGATSVGNRICSNLIGCDARQSTVVGNGGDGVMIHHGSGNLIGGETDSANVIVGSGHFQVFVHGATAEDNTGRNVYSIGRDPLSVAEAGRNVRVSKGLAESNRIR